MKKYLALFLTMAMSVGVLAGCGGGNEEPAATDGADTAERTTFTVGFDAEYPPYGFKNDAGEYVGFDLDLAQEVCDRNGWELIKQPIDWSSKDMELNSGTVDCLWNGFTMTGRESEYTFSEPYVDNSIVFVVRQDSDIQTKEDLAGKIVITQAGSSALTALTNTEDNDENLALAATFASLEQTPDYNSAFMSLETGAVDAIAVDIGVAQYQLTNHSDKFRQLEEPLSTEQYAIAFKLGNEELRDQVQATLDEMVEQAFNDQCTGANPRYPLMSEIKELYLKSYYGN